MHGSVCLVDKALDWHSGDPGSIPGCSRDFLCSLSQVTLLSGFCFPSLPLFVYLFRRQVLWSRGCHLLCVCATSNAIGPSCCLGPAGVIVTQIIKYKEKKLNHKVMLMDLCIPKQNPGFGGQREKLDSMKWICQVERSVTFLWKLSANSKNMTQWKSGSRYCLQTQEKLVAKWFLKQCFTGIETTCLCGWWGFGFFNGKMLMQNLWTNIFPAECVCIFIYSVCVKLQCSSHVKRWAIFVHCQNTKVLSRKGNCNTPGGFSPPFHAPRGILTCLVYMW